MSTQLQKLESLEKDIDQLKTSLQPFLQLGIENLEQQAQHKQFLQLHTRLMYALQSLSFIYAGIKGKQLPTQFQKVQTYYKRVEKGEWEEKPKTVVDKQKAKRLMKPKK